MHEKLERGTEKAKEGEKVLVPVRRYEVVKEAEQKTDEEPRLFKRLIIPRGWYIY